MIDRGKKVWRAVIFGYNGRHGSMEGGSIYVEKGNMFEFSMLDECSSIHVCASLYVR